MTGPLAIIPSRYGAQRFPGKPLALLRGRPMIEHVVARCREAGVFARVLVATDDERIASTVRSFGGEALMTSPACASGTDRVAEVARALSLAGDTVVVNVQGDEPAMPPRSLVSLVRCFDDASLEMATLVRPLDEAERSNPAVVKAVLDERDRALYFSRADLPFQRDAVGPPPPRWAHLGVYGYRVRTLLTLAALSPTALERAESLEQLRALGHGIPIACARTERGSAAVDRPEDVPLAEAALDALAAT
ncbi:MAG: 3-deoxy-manno-octulosonate cytidylyltransferase [Myxococcaceae bacterium]|jgi:3-deoxy-manno-octulosonate cytidylyltransferase (CMP-KDO synthetase)|nr:3-deoxy-manno-octulosonate cytidylyltransferase [Myxococcaceae bacterium]